MRLRLRLRRFAYNPRQNLCKEKRNIEEKKKGQGASEEKAALS